MRSSYIHFQFVQNKTSLLELLLNEIVYMSLLGFGVPNRRCRVFILASLHGDARDVLLTQVWFPSKGKTSIIRSGNLEVCILLM